eukprot:939385-Rhodomonas_salina.1
MQCALPAPTVQTPVALHIEEPPLNLKSHSQPEVGRPMKPALDLRRQRALLGVESDARRVRLKPHIMHVCERRAESAAILPAAPWLRGCASAFAAVHGP